MSRITLQQLNVDSHREESVETIHSIADENHQVVADHRQGMEGFTREISPWTLYVPVHPVPLSCLETLTESTSVDHDDDVHAVITYEARTTGATAHQDTENTVLGSKVSLLCRNRNMGDFDPDAWITHHFQSDPSITSAPAGQPVPTLGDDHFMHQFAKKPYRVVSGGVSAILPRTLQIVFGGSDQGKTTAMTVFNPGHTSTAMDDDGDFSISISNGSSEYRTQEGISGSNFMYFTREAPSDDRRWDREAASGLKSLLTNPATSKHFFKSLRDAVKRNF